MPALAAPASRPTRLERLTAAERALDVSGADLQPVTLTAEPNGTVTARVMVNGQPWTLKLAPHSLRTKDFRVLTADPAGMLVPVPSPPVRTYRGTVVEVPGSAVSGSVTADGFRGVIEAQSRTYGIQPAADVGLVGPNGEHVVYLADRWRNSSNLRCGVTDALRPLAVPPAATGSPAGAIGVKVAAIAVDADVEFFELNGSDVAQTVLDIETVLDAVAMVYQRDVGISYELTTIVVRTTEPDPYDATESNALFCQFRARWNTGPEVAIRRDVAHLFTGKNLNGSVIGIARFAVICNESMNDPFGCPGGNTNLAYGLSQSLFSSAVALRTSLTAHELGHDWNAFHCDGQPDCHIMCSTIGSCGGLVGENLKFGPTSTSSIVSFRDTRTCLTDSPSSLRPPFFEKFTSGSLNPTRWTYQQGGAVSSAALAEPSGPFSFQLGASGPGPFDDDEVRSNRIDLLPGSNVVLSYFTEHRGVETGEALFVDYRANDLTWRTLETIVSDGVDEDTFRFAEHVLPDDALHEAFRLRFRTDVDQVDDLWFLDDVRIVQTCADSSDCDDGRFCNGMEVCTAGICGAGPAPCGAGEGCDDELDECFSLACASSTVTDAANRYLSVAPAPGNKAVGLLVAPACSPSAVQFAGAPTGADNVAFLVNDEAIAAQLDPATWGPVVRLTGGGIVPATGYFVRTQCGRGASATRSQAVWCETPKWSDVVGDFEGGSWTPPDGVVNVSTDIISILSAFSGQPSAPPTYRVDLLGLGGEGIDCLPDQRIDIVDIIVSLSGFQGQQFSTATSCPVPCSAGRSDRR